MNHHDHDDGDGTHGDSPEAHDHGGDGHNADHHCHHAADATGLGVAVLMVSTSRTLTADESGDAIDDLSEGDGHRIARRDLVSDDSRAIREWVEDAVGDPSVDAEITTGGTGLSPDDVTVEIVEGLFDREMAGFGERFRARSADSVGPRAMLSDATAGIARGVPVFCLPSSVDVVTLGVSELVLPIVGHAVGLQRDGEDGASAQASATSDALTHVDQLGSAEMVNVGDKPASRRRPVTQGAISLRPETVAAIRADEVENGDVLGTVRVGAIDAVKHTWESIPMCHQIPITNVDTETDLDEASLMLFVAVETVGQTGCEMETVQGVTTGLNVAWDMVKLAEKDEDGQYPATRIEDVRVVEKRKTEIREDS